MNVGADWSAGQHLVGGRVPRGADRGAHGIGGDGMESKDVDLSKSAHILCVHEAEA